MSDFEWLCPECRARLEILEGGDLICPSEGATYNRRNGILVLMTEERRRHFAPFLIDYVEVRRLEGRGSPSPAYYRALPDRDLSGRHREEWRVRAASFRALVDRVLPEARAATGCEALDIADLGAGNCWMAHRLAERGHRVAAIDIFIDPDDGLGAHRHYSSRFAVVQAEFDNLPIGPESFDLAIFNGSLHYSTDLSGTLREALRVVRRGGALVVLDSPIYRDPAAGREMKAELHRTFKERYGFASDRLDSLGFLSAGDLDRTARELGLRWSWVRPFYGLRWALRSPVARLRGRREPASFAVLWARRTKDEP